MTETQLFCVCDACRGHLTFQIILAKCPTTFTLYSAIYRMSNQIIYIRMSADGSWPTISASLKSPVGVLAVNICVVIWLYEFLIK